MDLFNSYFFKVSLKFSWDINLNPGPVHEIQNENLLHVPPLYDCSFSVDGFDYNLSRLRKNVSRNDWHVFKEEECTLFTKI